MPEQWLPVLDIPVQGREFYFEEDWEWAGLCADFSLECVPPDKISAALGIFAQKQGIYIKGRIAGRAASFCARCLEPAFFEIDHQFELFEEFDQSGNNSLDSEILTFRDSQWMINVYQAIREQFVLAIPDKILCGIECQGLCPVCGQNLNNDPCHCKAEQGDPRLAAFKHIKIHNH